MGVRWGGGMINSYNSENQSHNEPETQQRWFWWVACVHPKLSTHSINRGLAIVIPAVCRRGMYTLTYERYTIPTDQLTAYTGLTTAAVVVGAEEKWTSLCANIPHNQRPQNSCSNGACGHWCHYNTKSLPLRPTLSINRGLTMQGYTGVYKRCLCYIFIPTGQLPK